MLTTTAEKPPAREGGIEMVPTKRGRYITVRSQKLQPPETPRQMGGAGSRHGVADSRCQAPASPHSARNGDALALARRTQIGPIRPRSGPRRRCQIAAFCATTRRRRHARTAATPSPLQGRLRSSSARWPASKTTVGEPRGIGPAAPFTGVTRLSRRRPRGATRGGGKRGRGPAAGGFRVRPHVARRKRRRSGVGGGGRETPSSTEHYHLRHP
jgi:hypothetical protein